jgi:hypothetical protein
VRIDLILEGNTARQLQFQGGGTKILFKRGLFSRVEETHVFLERKTSRIEGGTLSMLFLCEN